LSSLGVQVMAKTCHQVILETEVSNKGALKLYYNLGFVRDELFPLYYLNGTDAYRLRLWTDLPLPVDDETEAPVA